MLFPYPHVFTQETTREIVFKSGQSIISVTGDCIEELPRITEEVNCVVTSPPYYGLRDYGLPKTRWPEIKYSPMVGFQYFTMTIPAQTSCLGLEDTPEAYIGHLVHIFRLVRRVLRDDGTCWINIADSYVSGSQHAGAYGISDKAPVDYLDYDRLFQSLCGVCRVVCARKFHNDDLLAPMLIASLSESILSHMGVGIDRPPTSDFLRQVSRMINAIPGLLRAHEPLDDGFLAVQESTIPEFLQPLLAVCLERVSSFSCLLCGHSLIDDAPQSVHKSACSSTTIRDIQDKSAAVALLAHRNGYKDKAYECCNASESLYPPGDILPQRPLPSKNLLMIPARLALALQADGWVLRSDIIWAKGNPMPESVRDRPTKAHEYIYLLSKQARYWYDAEAIKEKASESTIERAKSGNGTAKLSSAKQADTTPNMAHSDYDTRDFRRDAERGRNKRTVWTVNTQGYPAAHFAVFPPKLIEPCILAGCPPKVCAECGKPYERDITSQSRYEKREPAHVPNNAPSKVDSTGWKPPIITDGGFKPSCDCGHGTCPGIVLDPFAGTGTTGRVAVKHRRRAILIDLSADYRELQKDRTQVQVVLPGMVA